ncbi:MAG: succinylglutamate desuccinylase/aspartoacylase family protein [Candidatus Nanoarchaeia archaeon]|jgi:succinylglutamate desuccinylase
MKLAIICCLHGTEPYGLAVAEQFSPKINFFVGNKAALEKSVRFVDVDLNRCFPGNINGNHEERIAYDLLKKVEDFDFIVDLHSSSNACPLFGLITKPNKAKIEFARHLGLSKLVIMPGSFANGKALIDFAKCGISFEIGPHQKKETIDEVAGHIRHFLEKKPANASMEIFEVFSVVKKQGMQAAIKNFEYVKKGSLIATGQHAEFDFTAVLVDEDSYDGILCLACRKKEC